jgi:microcompartment protein CcmK/EutM
MIGKRLLSALAILALCALVAPTLAGARKPAPRVGGKVKVAWPKRGKAPRGQMQRWLAKQVGGKKVKRGKRSVASASADPGADLKLVRSFEIPTDDPAYARLLNVSSTYDSALAASAFIATGSRAQAEQLLDQLAALQRTDGSIEYGFNTYTGAGSGTFRTGAVAWVALSAAYYKKTYSSTRYDDMADRAFGWLLEHQVAAGGGPAAGLLRGGPDVSWISTQHNMLAWFAFSQMAPLMPKNSAERTRYQGAADRIAAGINSRLLVKSGSSSYFVQGYNDPVRPLDVQNLGVLYLMERGDDNGAEAVAGTILSRHLVWGRSIAESSDLTTYNQTYSAAGPFAGFKPYADAGAPDVIWAEGTRQARLAFKRLGGDVRALDAETTKWAAVAPSGGPLMADRAVTAEDFNEYHVWPVSAAASWSLLAAKDPKDFLRP